MLDKFQKVVWFLRRPSFWPHAAELIRRKLTGAAGLEQALNEASAWAAGHAVEPETALRNVGALASDAPMPPPVLAELISDGDLRAQGSGVAMGGPGDLALLHAAILAARARRVLETGVAYGWSSLVALDALRETDGKLASVDMPYPLRSNEAFVGIVVPEHLRDRWTLIRRPDRGGIGAAIDALGGQIDLAHYDSDKSYPGRQYGYALLWGALVPGGVFISDDIQDNFAFRDFVQGIGVSFAVTSSGGKFVGIVRKPTNQ